MMGRPPEYTPEIGEAICLRIAEGESLRSICQDEGMPSKTTVLRWIVGTNELHKEFRDQYAQARRAQAEGWVEQVVDISDRRMVLTDEEGNALPFDPQWARLQVDTRKWFASKVLPKFADRLDINAKVAVSGIDDLLAATDEGEA